MREIFASLKTLVKAKTAKSLELMFTGGIIVFTVQLSINKHDAKIISEIKNVIRTGDSISLKEIKNIQYVSDFNTDLTIQRISTLEDSIYKDNKTLRKENQKLQNERFILVREKEQLRLLNYEKKNFKVENPTAFR